MKVSWWHRLCGLKSETICVEEKIWIRKKLNSLYFIFFQFFFNQGRGENKYQVQNQQKREIHTYVKKEAALI